MQWKHFMCFWCFCTSRLFPVNDLCDTNSYKTRLSKQMMSDNTEMQPRGYFILGLQLIIILNIRRHVMVTAMHWCRVGAGGRCNICCISVGDKSNTNHILRLVTIGDNQEINIVHSIDYLLGREGKMKELGSCWWFCLLRSWIFSITTLSTGQFDGLKQSTLFQLQFNCNSKYFARQARMLGIAEIRKCINLLILVLPQANLFPNLSEILDSVRVIFVFCCNTDSYNGISFSSTGSRSLGISEPIFCFALFWNVKRGKINE